MRRNRSGSIAGAALCAAGWLSACESGVVGGGGHGGRGSPASDAGAAGPADSGGGAASDAGGGAERGPVPGPTADCPGPGSGGKGGGTGKVSLGAPDGTRYIAYWPSARDPSAPLPALWLLHGSFQDPETWFMFAGELADKHGFMVVAPYAGSLAAWTPDTDAPRLDTVRADVAARFNVCTRRIYLGGASAGGGMTYAYGLPRSDAFAALGVWAAAGFQSLLDAGLIDRATRTLAIDIHFGTADAPGARDAALARDELGKRGHRIFYRPVTGVGHIPSTDQARKIFEEMWMNIASEALP